MLVRDWRIITTTLTICSGAILPAAGAPKTVTLREWVSTVESQGLIGIKFHCFPNMLGVPGSGL